MRVLFRTFGCKANQYDTERMRQEVEALGGRGVESGQDPAVCVVNTCTVTNRADADARRFIRRVQRDHPGIRVVVAGCSSALKPREYEEMEGVVGVVRGHDPVEVARTTLNGAGSAESPLVPLEAVGPPDRARAEPAGGELLRRRRGSSRGWLKIQDGCDRKCSFCATRLARGRSVSRSREEIVAEARLLARRHPELVLTGIHIGQYGRDLAEPTNLASLVGTILDRVPAVRLRLGSVEATEVDDSLVDLLVSFPDRLASHLHMPLQSGADPVLRAMRRWHTRETYRRRALKIARRLPVLGLGADIITGFPGEREEDHQATLALVRELPFTYLHVFPFSPRDDTPAAGLPGPVPQRVAGERSRELRELAREKGRRYRMGRVGEKARVVLEGRSGSGLTEDYLRVEVRNPPETGTGLFPGHLREEGGHLYIDLSQRSS